MFSGKSKKEYERVLERIIDGNFEVEPDKRDNVIEKILTLSEDLKMNREKVKELICGIFDIAVDISSFDLKLNYYSNEILSYTNKINDLNQTVQSVFEELSASIEEIDASTKEYNDVFEEVASMAENINEDVKENTNKVIEIKKIIDDTVNTTQVMEEEVDNLIQTTGSIEVSLQNINSIAEKINILALNAAIEANRAGEHGRGFAVVATEIRNLSNTTKEMVSSLSMLVEKINLHSKNSSQSVKKSVEGVSTINKDLSEMENLFLHISQQVEGITQDINTLKSSSDELTLSLGEASTSMMNTAAITDEAACASDELFKISNDVKDLGHSMEKLEVMITKTANKSGKMATDKYFRLENENFTNRIKPAINAHRAWIDTLDKMVSNMKVIPLQTDDTRCAFGHFYHTVKPTHPRILEIWNKVDSYHKDLHESGHRAIEYIKKGSSLEAQRLLDETRNTSLELIKMFEDILKISEELTLNKEFIM